MWMNPSKPLRILATGGFLGLGGLAPAMAQDAVIEQQPGDAMLSDDLIGLTIYTRGGGEEQDVGSIEGLLFDAEGEVIGVLVELGGFIGFGAKQVALAYDALDFQESGGAPIAAIVDLTRQQMEDAPSFKTQAALELEREQERLQQQQRQPSQPTQ